MSDPTPPIPPAPATATPAAKPAAGLKRFTYHGPTTGAAIDFAAPGAEPDVRDVQLHPGRAVELPADEAHVLVLVELGHLKPEAPATAAPGATKKKGGK